jgi:nitrate reductase molybdenum cofactor assembly chaperone NarJ/NarW
MVASRASYDRLAELFAYPTPSYRENLDQTVDLVREKSVPAAELLESFAENIRGLEFHELEESFTRTFDLNPACCPEIGWHLFGERYDRGSFMVWMRGQMRSLEIAETHELPDHLVHIMPVLGRMEGEEQTRFATQAVEPALAGMIEKIEDPTNPFRSLLESTQTLLIANHGEPAWKIDKNQAENHQGFELPIGSKE